MAWQARLCAIAGAIYNARNRMASLEIIRKRRLRGEVAKLVAAQDATDVAEDLVTADLKREQLRNSRSIRRQVRGMLWEGTKKQRHRWRREKLARMPAILPKKSPPQLTAANEAPELEDGLESASFPNARDITPGLCPAWLFPARWTSTTAHASSSGAKRVIPRGSVADELRKQQLQPVRAFRKTRRGAKKKGRPRSLRRQRPPPSGYCGDSQAYVGRRCRRSFLRAHAKAALAKAGGCPVLVGNTPLERWNDPRRKCSDPRRLRGLRSERSGSWPESNIIDCLDSPSPICWTGAPPSEWASPNCQSDPEDTSTSTQWTAYPPVPNYPPPPRPVSTTAPTSSPSPLSSLPPTPQPISTTTKAIPLLPFTTCPWPLRPTTPATLQLADSTGHFVLPSGSSSVLILLRLQRKNDCNSSTLNENDVSEYAYIAGA
jgi:hypothetical protein